MRSPERARRASCTASLPVGVDAIARFFGNQRGGHHPAVVALVHQVAVEPGATRAGFRDTEQMVGLCWHRADALIDIALAGAHGAQGQDLGAGSLRHLGNRDRIFVDIHADKECVRLGHRWPPMVSVHG